MNAPSENAPASDIPMPQPIPPVPAAMAEVIDVDDAPGEMPKVGPRYIWFMTLAQLGVFMAFITPLAISLTIRVNTLAPGHPEYLGFITGAGALFVMLTSPFMGIWSDRTRTRFGRRRPFMLGGMLIGVVSLFVMALAPNVFVVGLGWILAQWGWGTTLSNLNISQADRLPESQRGRVAGLTSFATQIAPVFGVVLAQFFTADALLLFLVPGAVGVLFVVLFVTLVHEDDSRSIPKDPMTVTQMLAKYLYNPRKHPDFSWNWLGRFLFYTGITLSTTYSAFFFADRLGVPVESVTGIIASLSLGGILAVTLGALGGGFLSDRLHRRRVFVLVGGVIMAAGMVTQGLAPDLTFLIVGSLLGSVGLGMFAAVDTALLLDVLPERETDAGRFMGIVGFATSIPQSIAPLLASAILLIGVSGDARNYTLVYIVGAVCVVLAGAVVLRIRSVR
ncbi:permease of the major facilitator superfamily [Microbacterium testaceum StLB037]|uniref:Permease of the major facilitator superfamily n=1 Tax=Microbacterium testaceum (strain StLB037) TaxID=979556 RepID=E8ND92_MICTS|nr:MFS transporter [Microbacterium testaceum]BAJ74950.1 permease of the major facilitator superfamily [Microbacterium testaceum StLB037]